MNYFYAFRSWNVDFKPSSKLPAVVVYLRRQLEASKGSTPPAAPALCLIKPGVIGVSLEAWLSVDSPQHLEQNPDLSLVVQKKKKHLENEFIHIFSLKNCRKTGLIDSDG